MSAYIVSDTHINVIVSYFVDDRSLYQLYTKIGNEYCYINIDNAGRLAYQLYRQNVKSVNRRYNEQTPDENYKFKYVPNTKDMYSIAEIAMALDGLEYQSCETDDYHQSVAWTNICNMRKHLLSKLPDYEQSETWEITKVKELV